MTAVEEASLRKLKSNNNCIVFILAIFIEWAYFTNLLCH